MKRLQFLLSSLFFLLLPQLAFSQHVYNYTVEEFKQMAQKGNKVFLYVENLDNISSFQETAAHYLKSEGYWKLSSNIKDADIIVVLTGFKIKMWGDERFECYSKIFDKKMNIVFRGPYTWKRNTNFDPFEECFHETVKSVIKSIPNEINHAKFVSTQNRTNQDVEFWELYKKSVDLSQDGAYKESIEYLNKCIKKNANFVELYQLRGNILLELDEAKKALIDFEKVSILDPLNSNIDRLWQQARYQRSERDEKTISRCLAIATITKTISNSINTSLNHSNNVTLSNIDNTANNGSHTNSKTERKECSFCHGTGINPSATSAPSFSGGYHYCDVCKKEVPDSHGYHGNCPSCNGRGYIISISHK